MVLLAKLVVCAALFQGNEALVSINSHNDRHLGAAEKYGADFEFSRADALARTMSVSHAAGVLEKMDQTTPELLSVVEKVSHGANSTAAPDVQASYSGVMKAQMRLNDMMYATHTKLDTVLLECKEFARVQHHRILELEADSEYYSQQVTSGNAAEFNARSQKSSWGDKIPIAEAELKKHNDDCVTELAELRHQLSIAKSDSEVMDSILNMTQCNDVAYEEAIPVTSLNQEKTSMTVVSCENTRTGRKYKKIRVNDPKLKGELAKLQHAKTLQALDGTLLSDKKKVALVQKTYLRKTSPTNSDNWTAEVYEGDDVQQVQIGAPVFNASVDPNMDAGAEKCAPEKSGEYLDDFKNSDMCPELRERFVNLAGGIDDAIEELTVMIANKQTKCMEIRKDLEAEIRHYNYWYKVWETRLANAIATLGESRTQFKNKYSELADAREGYATRMGACFKEADETSTEMCALRTIRNELVRMSYWDSVDNEVFDCTVAPEEMPDGRERREDHWAKNWDEGPCSQTCGKGTQALTRIVVQNPGPDTVQRGADEGKPTVIWQKGMQCPPLKEQQSCNEHRCPIDCALDEWEEWSRCTVTCGGGIRERMRAIDTHPTPNGNPCELTLESEVCNPAACDVDCVLSSWTEWSMDENGNPTCTKQCGGGQRTRIKTLVEPAKGHGTCAGFYDQQRFQVKQCNTQPCLYHQTVSTCLARVDVMLLIDGSGSLTRAGFAQVKEISMRLGGAIRGQGHLGALLFSGHTKSCARQVCTGQEPLTYSCRGWKNVVMTPSKCGINWVSRLSPNVSTVLEKISEMDWPKQNTLTSVAIKAAQIEMGNSRKGVPTLAIILTDGEPYSKSKSKKAAQEFIKAGGRIMMVPIGMTSSDKDEFKNYVSYPTDDNLILDTTFESLTGSNKTLNQMLTNFCVQFDEISLAPSDTTIYR